MFFKISYSQISFDKVVAQLANSFQTKVDNNKIEFQHSNVSGSCKAYLLEKGLSAMVCNYFTDSEVIIDRIPCKEFGIIIHFAEMIMEDCDVTYNVNDREIKSYCRNYFALRVISTQGSHKLVFPGKCQIKSISVFLEKEWIDKNLSGAFQKVISYLREINYLKEFMNTRQRKLFDEIFSCQQRKEAYPEIFIKSRMLNMLDNLLRNFKHRNLPEPADHLSEKDFEMIQKVEFTLMENIETGFPSIEKLSRLALMSESKLKKLFKQAFGMGMYEYFQKHRLARAKELIETGKYNITEIGQRIGYQNLGNFSAAFKKEFNCLPRDIRTGN